MNIFSNHSPAYGLAAPTGTTREFTAIFANDLAELWENLEQRAVAYGLAGACTYFSTPQDYAALIAGCRPEEIIYYAPDMAGTPAGRVALNAILLQYLEKQRDVLTIERDRIITEMVRGGATKAEVARMAGISRQRIDQIVKQGA